MMGVQPEINDSATPLNLPNAIPINHFNQDEAERSPLSPIGCAQRIAILKSLQSDSEPFMTMDMGAVTAALHTWERFLPDVQPFHSLQSNADPVLLQQLVAHPTLELGFNCTTREDVHLALELALPRRVLYTNPCLTNSALRDAKSKGVDRLAFESVSDLNRILLNHPDAELIFNLSTSACDADGDEEIALERAEELLQFAADADCQCIGLGLSNLEEEYRVLDYPRALAHCRRLFDYGRGLGLPLQLINLGDVWVLEEAQTFQALANDINEALRTLFPHKEFPQLQVIATPTRFFCEQAFSLVARVTDKHVVDATQLTGCEFDSDSSAYIYVLEEVSTLVYGCVNGAALLRGDSAAPRCHPLFASQQASERRYSAFAIGSISTTTEWELRSTVCDLLRPVFSGDWLIWQDMGAYSLRNIGSLDDFAKELPTTFYFYSSVHELACTQAAAAILQQSRCSSPSASAVASCDDGRGSSLGSDDEISASSEESTLAEEVLIEAHTEEEWTSQDWVLDWLENEFHQ